MVWQKGANPGETGEISEATGHPLRASLGRRALILGGLLLGAFLLLLLLIRVFTTSSQEEIGRRLGLLEYKPPAPAPDFRLNALGGKRMGLEDFRGKVVLLNFWATWCPPCRLEMPSLERLYREFKDEGFVVLAVSGDLDGEKSVEPFMEEHGLSFPALLDPEKRAFKLYSVRVIPSTYLIGREGKLISRAYGAREWDGREGKSYIAGLVGK